MLGEREEPVIERLLESVVQRERIVPNVDQESLVRLTSVQGFGIGSILRLGSCQPLRSE